MIVGQIYPFSTVHCCLDQFGIRAQHPSRLSQILWHARLHQELLLVWTQDCSFWWIRTKWLLILNVARICPTVVGHQQEGHSTCMRVKSIKALYDVGEQCGWKNRVEKVWAKLRLIPPVLKLLFNNNFKLINNLETFSTVWFNEGVTCSVWKLIVFLLFACMLSVWSTCWLKGCLRGLGAGECW